jgi:hypothetical protein
LGKRLHCAVRDFGHGDGVPDARDPCPDQPAAVQADSKRPGCPRPTAMAAACPTLWTPVPITPVVPSTDPKKNGRPGLVEINAGLFEIKQQLFVSKGARRRCGRGRGRRGYWAREGCRSPWKGQAGRSRRGWMSGSKAGEHENLA